MIAREGRHGGADPQHLSGSCRGLLQLVRSKRAGCWAIPSPRCRRPTKTPTAAGQRRALTEDELDAAAWTWHVAGRCWIAMTVRRGKRQGRSDWPSCGPKLARRLGTARAGTGLDLQDAGADRASQGRTGFDHRGASGPRRQHALPGLEGRRRKESRGIDDTASGRSCRRSSRMACRQGNGFAGSPWKHCGRAV